MRSRLSSPIGLIDSPRGLQGVDHRERDRLSLFRGDRTGHGSANAHPVITFPHRPQVQLRHDFDDVHASGLVAAGVKIENHRIDARLIGYRLENSWRDSFAGT